MKITLELNVVGKNTYINFWDTNHGNDINGTVLTNSSILVYDTTEIISFNEFCTRVIAIVTREG
jgi:hypothetical protein